MLIKTENLNQIEKLLTHIEVLEKLMVHTIEVFFLYFLQTKPKLNFLKIEMCIKLRGA